MKVLVLNCGSSSLKYQLFDMEDESVLAKGLIERIGISGSRIKHTKMGNEPVVTVQDIPNHKIAIKKVLEALLDKDQGVLSSLEEIAAVGHRVVHGGERFAQSAVLNDEVIQRIEEMIPLAPLHNPANLMGIRAMREALPNIPHVAVFDTAFHQTMPKHAYIYGIPYHYYEKEGIRRYGFHGTSHFYVANRAAEIIGRPISSLKIVTCHLGNGASLTAVDRGRCIDTSMGFGTAEGVLMGTRSGNVDPSVILYLMEHEGIDYKAMSHIIHKESGLLGISGISSDLRDVEEAAEKGNERASLALEMLAYGVRKYIGSYAAAMGGLDAIVFTAGMGENSDILRKKVCSGLEFLGAILDDEKNQVRGKEAFINTDHSTVKILVVPTNEELVIARDTLRLTKEGLH